MRTVQVAAARGQADPTPATRRITSGRNKIPTGRSRGVVGLLLRAAVVGGRGRGVPREGGHKSSIREGALRCGAAPRVERILPDVGSVPDPRRAPTAELRMQRPLSSRHQSMVRVRSSSSVLGSTISFLTSTLDPSDDGVPQTRPPRSPHWRCNFVFAAAGRMDARTTRRKRPVREVLGNPARSQARCVLPRGTASPCRCGHNPQSSCRTP